MIKDGYSLKKTIIKGVIPMLLFGIPILLNVLPSDILNLTVGGLLVGLLNFVKYNFSN